MQHLSQSPLLLLLLLLLLPLLVLPITASFAIVTDARTMRALAKISTIDASVAVSYVAVWVYGISTVVEL